MLEDNLPKYHYSHDREDKDISVFARHLSLIFKHIGLANAEASLNFGLSNKDDEFVEYHYWYHILSKSYPKNFLQRICYPKSTRKTNFVNYKDANFPDDNYKSKPSNNKNELRNIVYMLSAINYRKEVNQLEGVDETNFAEIVRNANNGEDINKLNVGKMLFDCVLSNGIQLLRKVKCYKIIILYMVYKFVFFV